MGGTEVERLTAKLTLDAGQYVGTLKLVQSQTKLAGAHMAAASTQTVGFSTAIGGLMAALAPVMAVFGSAKAFATFDQALIESTSIIEATAEEMEAMRKQALALSLEGTNSATDLAKGYFYLFSAGLNVKQAMSSLPAIQKFATAGAFDLATATSLAADAQSALGLRSDNVKQNLKGLVRVTDVLVKANVIANANVQQFSQALTSDAAASLRGFNKDMEEGVAVLAAYADQGIKGNKAGSMLGRVMTLLSNSAIKNSAAHKALGFQVFDANGKFRNFADIIQNLEQVLKGMSDEEKSATLTRLGFAALTQKAIRPLIGFSEKIRQYEKVLRDAGGTTEQVAKRQLAAFGNQMKIVWNYITYVAIDIGSILAPAFTKVGEVLKRAMTWWMGLDSTLKTILVYGGMFVVMLGLIPPLFAVLGPTITAVIGPLMGFLGVFTHFLHLDVLLKTVLLPLTLGFKVLGTVLLTLINPIRLIKALIWPLVFGFKLFFGPQVTLIFTLLKVVAVVTILVMKAGGLRQAWEAIEKAAVDFWEWILPIRQALESLGRVVWDLLVEEFVKLGEHMLELVHYALEFVHIDWLGVATMIRDGIVTGILFAEYALRNFEKVNRVVWAGVTYYATRALNEIAFFFTGTLPYTLKWFSENWSAIWFSMYKWTETNFDILCENIGQTLANYGWDGSFQPMVDAAKRVGGDLVSIFSHLDEVIRGEISFDQAILRDKISAEKLGAFWQDAIIKGEADLKEVLKLRDELVAEVKAGTKDMDQSLYFYSEQGVRDQINQWKEAAGTMVKEKDKFLKDFVGPEKLKINPFLPPTRIPPETENKLKEEWERLGGELLGDFAEWRKKRIKEMAEKGELDPDSEEAMRNRGEEGGKQYRRGFEGEMRMAEASLARSSEGLSRILEYRNRMMKKSADEMRNANAHLGGDMGVDNGIDVTANVKRGRAEDLLVDIRDILRQDAKKPPIQVVPAELA